MNAPSAAAPNASSSDLAALAAAAPDAAAAGVGPRDVDQLCVDTIRMLAVDMTNAANSGHPGMPMGMADVAYTLWTRYLRYDPKDPAWRDRDRFVLSAGHGSALLYALLHLSGYDLPLDELRRFRQFGSRTAGHPERGVCPGVEVTTGPLGQGIANAVGIALAQTMTAARFGSAEHPVATGRVFCIVGDGCLMEGISAEAASLAGHLRLGNLKVCYDSNRISIDGSTDVSFTEDVAKRFEAHGWHVVACDGNDRRAFAAAFDTALAVTDRPSLVICRTVIGKGSPNRQGTEKVHGSPLGAEETKLTKAVYHWPLEPAFVVPREVYARFAEREREVRAIRAAWDGTVAAWRAAKPEAANIWEQFFAREGPSAAALLERLAKGAPFGAKATRQHSQAIQQKVAAEVPNLVGGSADLAGSNLTWIAGSPAVGPVGTAASSPDDFIGRNLNFGVREHAMGAIANGIDAHGAFVPFTATFLAFLDYMREPVRLAALSHHRSIFVFSHDSIGLGEDGPTHQPVEHLWTARMIPGMTVHRPADGLETAAAWADAVSRRDRPTMIVTSRQKMRELPRPGSFRTADLLRGGYVVQDPLVKIDLVLIATGSEVGVALDAADLLGGRGVGCRVVSMPCVELFDRQDDSWRRSVLPPGTKRVAIEAGRTDGWWRFVGENGLVIGIDSFGMSAPAEQIYEHFGITGPKAAERIAKHFGFAT